METVREQVLSVRLEMEYAEELCMLARLLLRKILQLLIYRLGSEILSVSIGMVTRQMF